MMDDYARGAHDALEYAAGFLDGAANGARVFGLSTLCEVFEGVRDELLTGVTPDMVRAAAEERRHGDG